ncbi:hypothetical protein ATCC90586_008512 [Pythium insidiosum]|nr:hypothetical protein ATCC90586_008512 [Pythium insidiosum]
MAQPHGLDDAIGTAQLAWRRFYTAKPLLYLPDRTPHSDFHARRYDGERQLWSRRELEQFQAEVERRTQQLLAHQDALRAHWRRAATQLQRVARGVLARRRVFDMRHALEEAARRLAEAKAEALRRRLEHRSAHRIQCAYRRHAAYLAYLLLCRQRLQRALRLHVFRWRRRRSARVLQRAYRAYRRRVRLWRALATIMRMLRASRRREALERNASAFVAAREAAKQFEWQRRRWRRPLDAEAAERVAQRKGELLGRRAADQRLPVVAVARGTRASPSPERSLAPSANQRSHSTSLPRLRR